MKKIVYLIILLAAVGLFGYWWQTKDKAVVGEPFVVPVQSTKEADTVDHSGTHIMPDGSVMTGEGEVIADAVILPDGNIRLSDGTVIKPAFDQRPAGDR